MTPLKAILLILICISAVVAINGCDEAKERYDPVRPIAATNVESGPYRLRRMVIGTKIS